jgi:dihydrodipicolinate synthase/N-acetylneuraminate lyase
MLLDGMHLPLMTPFQPDGRLNLRKFEDNVRRYAKTPAAGLVALSRGGQPSLLTDDETREALRAVAETAAAEKVLLAGIARDSAMATVDLIAFAAETGYDAALVPVPSILRGGGERESREVLSFYRAVADQAALPIVLDSGTEGYGEIATEVAVELAYHPNVIGLVDGSGDAARIEGIVRGSAPVRRDVTVTMVFAAVTRRMLARNVEAAGALMPAEMLAGGGTALSVAAPSAKAPVKTRTKSVGFQVLCGRTAGMLEALLAGAVGAVPPLAACAPQACYEVLAAWKDGDPALAAEKQERLRLVSGRVEEELGVSGIKYGSDLNGYFGGRPRLPVLPLTGLERAEVEAAMAGVRN